MVIAIGMNIKDKVHVYLNIMLWKRTFIHWRSTQVHKHFPSKYRIIRLNIHIEARFFLKTDLINYISLEITPILYFKFPASDKKQR